MEYNDNLYSSRTTRTTNYQKILKLIKKTNLHKIQKNIYRPINPSHPFNSTILNPKEISKRKNAHLIINNTIKDIIKKYNNDKNKSNEKIKNNKYFYYKFKDEDKNYYLALKSILKKDFAHLPKFLSENKNNKKKKINLKINVSRNNKNFFDKLTSNNNSLGYLTTNSQIKGYNTESQNFGKTLGIFQYSNKIKKSKNLIKNNHNLENIEAKLNFIKNARTTKQLYYTRKFKLKINNLNIKKQLNFSITNMKSAKLGRISIFGVFEDMGIDGKMISTILINYLIDYFEKCKEMSVSLEKDNFYSILHWSFINAQKYLKNNIKKFNIDLYNSGCMCSILLVPKNNRNIFYCANVGKCKCLIYTNRGTDTLCFWTNIDRISERERIFNIIRNRRIKKLEKDLKKKDDIKQNQDEKEENKNKSKNTSISEQNNQEDKNIIKDKEKQKNIDNNPINNIINNTINNTHNVSIKEESYFYEEEKIDEEKYINYFREIGITRCFGNLSGECMGLSPDPEITECDLRLNKVKFAVLGNTIFWKYLDEKEVRFIVSKYLDNNDTVAATKELEELIKQKVGISSRVLLDSSFVVVYFDTIV